MKKLILAILMMVVVIGFSSCGSADRTLDGPPKYDVNGKKVGGDDLYDEEVLKIQAIKKMIEALNDSKRIGAPLNVPPGWLNGHIINYSGTIFNVVIYMNESKKTKLFSSPVAPRSYVETFLPPGYGYFADLDNGNNSYCFDVVVTATTNIDFEKEKLSGFFYLYKDR